MVMWLQTLSNKNKAKANGALVERVDVYIKVYRRKDGAAVTPHVQENMNRMEELLSQEGMRLQGELGSGVLWSIDDAYAWVFGLESPGRVYGGGDLESPHLEEVSQTLHSLPRLHRRQPERLKGFSSWRTTPLSLGSN
ncbi:hypothetical protein SO802_011826 [Lithocarpus litseifolius]|uniref:Uncharacterized protein n=1 Tax=Lithocarpus litseifolius TaxID=425828 RepID=A0AAW2D4J5_9ROSI